MAVEIVVQPYELLVRFDEDGTVRGIARRRLRVIRDGEEIISAQELPAEEVPVTPDLAAMLQAAEASVAT